jgi:hypothetical protein
MSFFINSPSFIRLAALGTIALASISAQAQTTVFSTFGPGNSFSQTDGWFISGPTSGYPILAGLEVFRPLSSGYLFDIMLPLVHYGGAANTNEAHVFLSEANALPGMPTMPVLESWVVRNLPQYRTNITPSVLTSVNNPFLDASKDYFLYSRETGSQWNTWNYYNNSNQRNHYLSYNNGAYDLQPGAVSGAYSVRVNSSNLTPEMPGIAQFLPALLPLGFFAAKRRKKA